MASIRFVLRLTLVVLFSCLWSLLRVLLTPAGWVAPKTDRRLHAWMMRVWAGTFLRLGGVRVRLEGVPPARPCFFVCNHLSWLDILVVTSQLGSIFIARADIAHWFLVGPLAKSGRTLFIERGSLRDIKRAQEAIRERIEDGYSVAIFPEGGIPQHGKVEDFKPALIDVAVKQGWPIYHGALIYGTPEGAPPASELIHWTGDKSLIQSGRDIFGLSRVHATLVIGKTPLRGDDRKQLARELTSLVREAVEKGQPAARST